VAVNRGELDGKTRPSRAEGAERALESGPDPFVGPSAALGEFLARLRRAARSESTVLISGASGSGKTRAALRLHRWSARAERPYVAVSLVATTGTLVEATLFGHERGAFTDAHRSRLGIFRRADTGTVLLDDVEHLPLDTQVKLLRVLQERVVDPVGAEQGVPVDVRIVATTSRPLEELVARGAFREDLYYRLAVLPLEVPPLRARRDDLEALAGELVRAVAARAGVAPRPFAPEGLERLRAHSWPGNVRELENAIERVLVLAPGPAGGAPAVGADELAFLEQDRPEAVDELARRALALGLGVDDLARAMMERALAEARGNVSAAARSVGLTRRAFEYRRNAAGAGPEEEPE
jgi:DNA-binding NtrC family response regulator